MLDHHTHHPLPISPDTRMWVEILLAKWHKHVFCVSQEAEFVLRGLCLRTRQSVVRASLGHKTCTLQKGPTLEPSEKSVFPGGFLFPPGISAPQNHRCGCRGAGSPPLWCVRCWGQRFRDESAQVLAPAWHLGLLAAAVKPREEVIEETWS